MASVNICITGFFVIGDSQLDLALQVSSDFKLNTCGLCTYQQIFSYQFHFMIAYVCASNSLMLYQKDDLE